MKVIVSDYDQTFYLDDTDIKINIDKIKKFRSDGNLFIIATGRCYLDFINKVHQYNLEYDYVILNHGTTIMDNKDNVISNYPMDDDLIKNIINDLDLDNSVSHFFCNLENSRCSSDDKDIIKINVKYENRNKALEIKKLLDTKYLNDVNSYVVMSGAIEIMSSKVDKAFAINELVEKLNLNEKDIYTIGDGYSDILMLKKYNGYCMKDSIENLKGICKENQVDSVSKLIDIIS